MLPLQAVHAAVIVDFVAGDTDGQAADGFDGEDFGGAVANGDDFVAAQCRARLSIAAARASWRSLRSLFTGPKMRGPKYRSIFSTPTSAHRTAPCPRR